MVTKSISHVLTYKEVKATKYNSATIKKLKLKLHKLTHWEYWPFQMVYIPMYFVWLYYSIKAKSLFFFNASNPLMKNGGFLMESKKEIYDLMPPQYYPKTILAHQGILIQHVKENMISAGLQYPLIAKPDIGMRGMAVQKINNEKELQHYVTNSSVDFLIQEFIDLPNEIGVFFVRIPGETTGQVTGIVAKEFLVVKGDGRSTLLELLEENPRFYLQLPVLEKEYANELHKVLQYGEEMNLVPYGNHCRGTKFIDASGWINKKINDVFNHVCLQVPEFYYGRLDLKYNTLEELEEGKNFSIIELNGAGSEPTHIYDPSHSIFYAWKEIARHFRFLYIISKANKNAGASYLNWKQGFDMLKENNLLTHKLKSFSVS